MRLPVELVILVLSESRAEDLLRWRFACHLFVRILNPRAMPGRNIWKRIREQMGAPDGSKIGISDMRLVSKLATRGCDDCNLHPRLRNVYWEFSGARLCQHCFRKRTARDYEIGNSRQSAAVPYIQTDFRFRGENEGSYRTYLWAHLRDPVAAPDQAEVRKFKVAMTAYFLARREQLEAIRQQRRQAIDAYLGAHMPTGRRWTGHPCYLNACKRAQVLTARSAKMLLTKIRDGCEFCGQRKKNR